MTWLKQASAWQNCWSSMMAPVTGQPRSLRISPGKNPRLRVIRHTKNRGYGGALKTGFSQAQGDLVGFLDADGTYPPEYFPQLCQKAMEGADLVVGSRMAGAESQMPATRRVGNLFFANLLSILGRQRVTDSASGMRIFSRSILEQIYPLPDGLNLTPVMSTRALHESLRVAEVPIPYSERVGRSKLSVVRDGTVFLQSIVWTVMCYNPVRIFGLLGLAGIRHCRAGWTRPGRCTTERDYHLESLDHGCPVPGFGGQHGRRQPVHPGSYIQLPGGYLL